MKSKQHDMLKTQHAEQARVNEMYKDYVAKLDIDYEVLQKISNQNENLRKRCTQDLQAEKSKNDKQANYIGTLEQNRKFYEVKYEVIEEQFKLLYDSIENISNAKNQEDKFQ